MQFKRLHMILPKKPLLITATSTQPPTSGYYSRMTGIAVIVITSDRAHSSVTYCIAGPQLPDQSSEGHIAYRSRCRGLSHFSLAYLLSIYCNKVKCERGVYINIATFRCFNGLMHLAVKVWVVFQHSRVKKMNDTYIVVVVLCNLQCPLYLRIRAPKTIMYVYCFRWCNNISRWNPMWLWQRQKICAVEFKTKSQFWLICLSI